MALPTMTPVESSNIHSIGHDAGTNELYVKFQSGTVYKHAGVTKEKHDDLMASPSKGSHYSKNIRGQHTSEKVA